MKKIERSVKTDRFEAVLVYWELEPDDFYPGPNAVSSSTSAQESYLMIGPPGGPFARIDGIDANIVVLLLQTTMTSGGHVHGCSALVPRR